MTTVIHNLASRLRLSEEAVSRYLDTQKFLEEQRCEYSAQITSAMIHWERKQLEYALNRLAHYHAAKANEIAREDISDQVFVGTSPKPQGVKIGFYPHDSYGDAWATDVCTTVSVLGRRIEFEGEGVVSEWYEKGIAHGKALWHKGELVNTRDFSKFPYLKNFVEPFVYPASFTQTVELAGGVLSEKDLEGDPIFVMQRITAPFLVHDISQEGIDLLSSQLTSDPVHRTIRRLIAAGERIKLPLTKTTLDSILASAAQEDHPDKELVRELLSYDI